GLEDRFEVAGRQLVPGRHGLRGDRHRRRVESNADDGGEGESAASGHQDHAAPPPAAPPRPVEPKPPPARPVAGRSSASTRLAVVTGAITSWAILLPRATDEGSA